MSQDQSSYIFSNNYNCYVRFSTLFRPLSSSENPDIYLTGLQKSNPIRKLNNRVHVADSG